MVKYEGNPVMVTPTVKHWTIITIMKLLSLISWKIKMLIIENRWKLKMTHNLRSDVYHWFNIFYFSLSENEKTKSTRRPEGEMANWLYFILWLTNCTNRQFKRNTTCLKYLFTQEICLSFHFIISTFEFAFTYLNERANPDMDAFSYI